MQTSQGPREVTVCAYDPPAAQPDGSAAWPIIAFLDNWGCGKGADAITMQSYIAKNPPSDGTYGVSGT